LFPLSAKGVEQFGAVVWRDGFGDWEMAYASEPAANADSVQAPEAHSPGGATRSAQVDSATSVGIDAIQGSGQLAIPAGLTSGSATVMLRACGLQQLQDARRNKSVALVSSLRIRYCAALRCCGW